MKNDSTQEHRRGLWLSLAALGLIATFVCTLPLSTLTQASADKGDNGLAQITQSHQPGFENYDIRQDKKAQAKLASFRAANGKNSASIAKARQAMSDGEANLRRRVPTLKVEYNDALHHPEVIAPIVTGGKAFLTNSIGSSRAETLRSFIKENTRLIGVAAAQADDLVVTADYTNPNGVLSFASLEQRINGIPVFLGEVKAGFDKQGRLFRVINNLAPGLDNQFVADDFGSAENAVQAAFGNVARPIKTADLVRNVADSTDLKVKFGEGDWTTTAEKMYFPIDNGTARAAWRVLIWEDVAAYLVLVDAETNVLLWRKNITNDQTQAATYSVYANSTSMVKALDSPAALTPGPINPGLGTQGIQVARTNLTLIGNEAPNGFNNLGWITDGANGGNGWTDGNNVQAGVDLLSPSGVDAPAIGTSRVFDFNYNPAPGLGGATPDALTTADSRNGAVTQLFYYNNRYHDELYKLGFTEAAGNFQNNNFGRGGAAADRVSAEAQDYAGTNNANFSTPPDGFRGRMQMYRFTQTPNRDGDLDGDIVLHEHTHGLSNRLHGNGSGLSTAVSASMGEGWSDFYGIALLSEPTDPVNGIYSTGAYATYNVFGIGLTNSYYGIRRFPYAPMAYTGGSADRPYNPLTFKDIDPLQANISDGAYPASSPFAGSPANEVHNAGEVWCSALIEVRAKLINSAGGNVAAGNLKALQFVTDGMKLAPLAPNFLQERDAIIAGAINSGTAQDVADIWAGFAVRGMGFSALQNPGSFNVIEAFDLANVVQIPNLTYSDSTGNNNGVLDPGENITLNIPLNNSTGNNAIGVTLQLVNGGSANYGNIAFNTTVNRTISYTVPANTPCGSSLTLTFNVSSNLGTYSFTRRFIVGTPIVTATENFDGVATPTLPSGWTSTQTSAGVNFATVTNSADTAPNSVFTPDLTVTGGGTDLTSPAFPINTDAGLVTFRHRYDTEAGWDGGVLEISINNAAFQDIISAGGSFITNGYNGALGAAPTNPLANRNAWNGNSGGYITTTAQLPASANNQTVRLRWRFGADDNTVGSGPNPGWNIDSISISGNYSCSNVQTSNYTPFDFDGDHKADLSVFRPSGGNWFVNRSTDGFLSTQFGLNGDIPTPADFDADGRADIAVFRPSNGFWYRLNSSNNAFSATQFGLVGDAPRPGDFDGDARADIAVFRPSNGFWYRLNSSTGEFVAQQFGLNGDVPILGNFDEDNKADIAVWRPSNGTWYRLSSATGAFASTQFGLNGDIPVAADYDGDGRTDVAVFRPSSTIWYRLNSTNGLFVSQQFGLSSDIPIAADYDGDGRADIAVYRGSQGVWYRLNSQTNEQVATQFGLGTDVALPSVYNKP